MNKTTQAIGEFIVENLASNDGDRATSALALAAKWIESSACVLSDDALTKEESKAVSEKAVGDAVMNAILQIAESEK